MAKVHVRVRVKKVDESLSSISSCSDQRNLGWLSVGRVLVAEGWVGVSVSSIST
jgi:hypothetical protein